MAKKVFIDPGHGGNDSGAVGVDKLLEKNINLSVAKKVKDLLIKQGLEVKLSRESDTTVSLEQRTTAANNWKADCFVSIHCNAYNTAAHGIETFSYTESTSNLAKDVHSEVIKTGAYTVNRGTKTASFYVLKHTNMRAALIELAFIDNKEDAKILTTRQDDLALGVAKGICKYLGIEYKPDSGSGGEIPPVVDTNTFYRVVCGSFNNRVYAEERVEELKQLGYEDTFIIAYTKE
ncbi:N-acetylmuramoyl-L-alanine amidase [Romboutsia sp.]|uniref:N-acetylmuramoyl-L-alanine amidase n=1 Tax=Romboutsia sp. TaxID=1965302 RepID=UPI003F3463BB